MKLVVWLAKYTAQFGFDSRRKFGIYMVILLSPNNGNPAPVVSSLSYHASRLETSIERQASYIREKAYKTHIKLQVYEESSPTSGNEIWHLVKKILFLRGKKRKLLSILNTFYLISFLCIWLSLTRNKLIYDFILQ